MNRMRRRLFYFDWPLVLAVAAITVLGIVNLYSAANASPGRLDDIYLQQLYWVTLGAGLAAVAVAFDYRHLERNAWVAYGAGIILLVLVFLVGRNIRGSQRWIPIGSFSLQPSEIMKLVLVIALAKYLHHDAKTEGRTLKDLLVPGLILALPMALILAQPDLGTALVCAFIFGSVMMLTQLKFRAMVTLVCVVCLSAPLTWTYLLKDYQKRRITAFLNPDSNLLSDGWHTHQSLVAIGSGRWLGKGYLQGSQNQHGFLPDQHTDFPFPVWAEEHGFLGTIVLIGLYLFIILWGLKIAAQAKDRFGAVLAVGVSALVFWQVVINLGMVMGLLPVVGVTLPLFSYGGSSVVAVMIGLGLLLNVSIRRFSF